MAKKKAHLAIPDDYPQVLEFLKQRVRYAQTKAMLSANSELIGLYWDIGRQIAQRQQDVGWGRGVVDRLSKDLRSAFRVPRNREFFCRKSVADAGVLPRLSGSRTACARIARTRHQC